MEKEQRGIGCALGPLTFLQIAAGLALLVLAGVLDSWWWAGVPLALSVGLSGLGFIWRNARAVKDALDRKA